MKRRDFIALLGCVAAAWPLAARAQQTGKLPTIGWLDSARSAPDAFTAFNLGLAEQGYVLGRNVKLDYLSAEGDPQRDRALVEEFVRRQVAVIVPTTGTAAQAAKAVTQTTPIVFSMGGDPVEEGLVSSLNRPGGNVTGLALQSIEVTGKRLELLHKLVPAAAPIAMLVGTVPAA